MADKVVKVVVGWVDAAGAQSRSIYLVKRHLDVDGSLIKSDTEADANPIVSRIDAITKMKFVKREIVIPIDRGAWNTKTDPLPGSSVNKQAWVEFLALPGDSLKATKTRIFIPSPRDAILAGNNTHVDFQSTDVQAFVNTVLQRVLTLGGTMLAGAGASNVRVRRSRK